MPNVDDASQPDDVYLDLVCLRSGGRFQRLKDIHCTNGRNRVSVHQHTLVRVVYLAEDPTTESAGPLLSCGSGVTVVDNCFTSLISE